MIFDRVDMIFSNSLEIYFKIQSKGASKFITANSSAEIIMEGLNNEDNQLWFWDQPYLRNKDYPTKVLEWNENMENYLNNTKWDTGILLLTDKSDKEGQHFTKKNDEIECKLKNLKLDIKNGFVGCGNKDNPQLWEFKTGTYKFDFEFDFGSVALL